MVERTAALPLTAAGWCGLQVFPGNQLDEIRIALHDLDTLAPLLGISEWWATLKTGSLAPLQFSISLIVSPLNRLREPAVNLILFQHDQLPA